MKTKRKSRLRKLLVWVSALCLGACAATIVLRGWTATLARGRVFDGPAAVPSGDGPRVAIVFGAGVWRGGQPSPILYDRVATAAALYHSGRVRTLLMTGDNRFKNYNEPAVMKETAVRLGVPAEAVALDFAGRRTYDSCYRAREIFGVRRALLVTQKFHLDRALYICNALGVEGAGVAADRREYPAGRYLWWSLREVPATVAAWGDLNLLRPAPVLGEKIPLEAAGPGDEGGT